MSKRSLLISTAAFLLLCAGCGERSTPAEVWVDYCLSDNMPLGREPDADPSEFPGVTFTWTSDEVTASSGGESIRLFGGMPVWSVYLCDLTGDGKPEFCASVSMGSGIIDDRVIVYDYASGSLWELQDRRNLDYRLEQKGSSMQVVKSEYAGPEISRGTLALVPDGDGNLQLLMES